MPQHRFVVNVPNPTAKSIAVVLSLKPGKAQDIDWMSGEYKKRKLDVLDAGLGLDCCMEKGAKRLKLRLEPLSSVDVHILITTAASAKPATAGFHVMDDRGGGVFLVCADPPYVEPVGIVVNTPDPCPAVLAKPVYLTAAGADPSQPPQALNGVAADLVAHIRNPTKKALQEVQVYLEHLGSGGLSFTPGTWNVGTLDKGDVFYACWPVHTAGAAGVHTASIVVASKGADAVRLSGSFSVHPREGGAVPKARKKKRK